MNDEPEEMGIPEWVVTFGDMMSLLLTFFIMLVSLSEIKEEETYQALVDSMQQQFGYAQTIDALTPGESRPRTSGFQAAGNDRPRKEKGHGNRGVPEKAPSGEEPQVRIVRPGQMTAVGSVVFFDLGSDEISKVGRCRHWRPGRHNSRQAAKDRGPRTRLGRVCRSYRRHR